MGIGTGCGCTTQIRSEAPITMMRRTPAWYLLGSGQVLLASRYGPLASVVLEISRDAGDSRRCRGPRPTAVHVLWDGRILHHRVSDAAGPVALVLPCCPPVCYTRIEAARN